MIDSFFTEEELNPGKDVINEFVDELAHKLYNGGKIKSEHSNSNTCTLCNFIAVRMIAQF